MLTMLRSLLVALDGSRYSETATTLALDWAVRFGARLVGVGIVDEPSIHGPEAVPLGGGAYKKARDEVRTAHAHRRVEEFLEHFRTRGASTGVMTEVLEEIGEPSERILREAHRCDAVILARETHFHFETQDQPDTTLAHVLRSSPRPIVVIPRELRGGEGVLVAYGGGREAARALQTFQLLGLADGEDIEILTVHRDGAEAEARAYLAGEFLEAHGARYHLQPITSEVAPAKVIAQELRHRRPRLLVIGAHGHHPLRDLFVTSVTREVLSASPVPVFVGA
jgi:nucleotide-binding universal stress UspA family protein